MKLVRTLPENGVEIFEDEFQCIVMDPWKK
jgi:hypothetical protein